MFPWVITLLLLFVRVDCVCMLWRAAVQCVRSEAQAAVVDERDSDTDWTSRVVLGGDARRHQHSTTMLRHAQLTHAPFHSSQTTKKVKVAQTRLPSVGFWS